MFNRSQFLLLAAWLLAFAVLAEPSAGQFERFPAPNSNLPAPPPLPPLNAPSGVGAPDDVVETLEQDVTSWYNPASWIQPVQWEGSVEVGVNASTGNSESLSLTSGYDLKRETEFWKLNSDLLYTKITTQGAETQHNALMNLGAERLFGESPWSLFLKAFLEYDEFKAFDLRIALNGGVGYKFIDTETTELGGRFGAGASHEIGGPDDAWVPEAVFGGDFEHKLTDRQKLTLVADYFPEWGDFADYRVVAKANWVLLLDEEHNLNLKIGLVDRYDSTPNGRRPNDIIYTLVLLWKM